MNKHLLNYIKDTNDFSLTINNGDIGTLDRDKGESVNDCCSKFGRLSSFIDFMGIVFSCLIGAHLVFWLYVILTRN